MVYVPHSDADKKKMLDVCGLDSAEDLFATIPEGIKQGSASEIPEPMTEAEVLGLVSGYADENFPLSDAPSFLGAGLYKHFQPSVIGNILSRGEFLTSYTPYQAEASQGTLQAIYEYQSMMAELTGMDVSNASSYDGGTACADALVLVREQLGKKRRKVLVSQGLHPEYRQTMATYNFGLEMEIEEIPLHDGLTDYDKIEKLLGDDIAGVFIQYPNCLGIVENIPELEKLNRKISDAGAISVAVCYPIALGVLKPPGEIGFDVACGEGQAMGMPVSFGGPLLGYFTSKQSLIRKLPGRLVGRTVDICGDEGFVLNLQAREQHIRREKATSNICTNQAMCALAASVYMTYWGKKGFPLLGKEIIGRAGVLAECITEIDGVELKYPGKPVFNEVLVKLNGNGAEINDKLFEAGQIGGFPVGKWFDDLQDCMLLAVTECTTLEEIGDLCEDLAMIVSGESQGGGV